MHGGFADSVSSARRARQVRFRRCFPRRPHPTTRTARAYVARGAARCVRLDRPVGRRGGAVRSSEGGVRGEQAAQGAAGLEGEGAAEAHHRGGGHPQPRGGQVGQRAGGPSARRGAGIEDLPAWAGTSMLKNGTPGYRSCGTNETAGEIFERFERGPVGGPLAGGYLRANALTRVGAVAVSQPGRETHDASPFGSRSAMEG